MCDAVNILSQKPFLSKANYRPDPGPLVVTIQFRNAAVPEFFRVSQQGLRSLQSSLLQGCLLIAGCRTGEAVM